MLECSVNRPAKLTTWFFYYVSRNMIAFDTYGSKTTVAITGLVQLKEKVNKTAKNLTFLFTECITTSKS